MSCSKPMYEPSKCDGQPCPGDCDSGCPLAYTFDDEDEPQTERPWGMYIDEHPMYE